MLNNGDHKQVQLGGAIVHGKLPYKCCLAFLLFLVTMAGTGTAVAASPTPEVLPAVGITPDPTIEGPSFEVQSYEEDFDVSSQTAEKNLAIQQQAVGVVEGLEHALGEDYAGVWFDNENGEFVVPVVGSSSQLVVSKILSNSHLEGHFRIAPAQYSWTELETVQEQINKSSTQLVENGLVQTYLDARTNAVIVREADDASAADESQLRDLAADQDGKVEMKQKAVPRFNVELMCKTTPPRGCNKPLRGGVAMSPPGEYYAGACTVGFKAVDNSTGDRYILTAGHCAAASPDWEAEDGSGNFHPIGSVMQYKFPGGDWAKINAVGSYWDSNPWPSMVAHFWEDQERLMTSESRSYLGEYVCHSGNESGTTCGSVVALNITEEAENGQTVHHAVEFGEVCIISGDSGGPVFKGNTAIGIFNAGWLTKKPESICRNNSVGYGQYMEITEATENLGVSVGARGEAPVANTSGASGVQPYQATANGTVDPNGAETSYRFEYGTTVGYGNSTSSWSAGSGWDPSTVSGTISGLEPAMTYHYRIVASNGFGTSYGNDQQFTTPPVPPTVGTKVPSGVTSVGATLNGSVNPNGAETKYLFEYGFTTSYGTKTTEVSAGAGRTPIIVSKALTGLEFGATYHYRIVASNSAGTSVGTDQSFTPGWYMQGASNPEGAQSGALAGVSCSLATECTGVGQYINGVGGTVTLAERWNGTKWAVQSSPNPSGEMASSLAAVACPSASSCLAVGHYVSTSHTEPGVQKALVERWDGSKWELLTPATPEGSKQPTLEAIACLAASDCTATGSYVNGSGATVPLAEHWNGTSWQVQSTPSPEGATSSSLLAISCSSSTACTAVGSSSKVIEHEESITTTLAERWNGTSWSIQSTPNPSGNAPALEGVSCVSTTECIAIGQYSSSGEKVLAERWNGTSWSLQTISNPEGASIAYLIGISCTSSSSCTAVGYTGEAQEHTSTVKTLAERWNGSKWEAQSPLNVESGSMIRSSLAGIWCKSSIECTAVGNYESSTGVNVPLAEGYFKSPPPSITTKAASAITEGGATLNGSVNPNGTETKYFFEYGPTTSYGTQTAEVSAGSGTTAIEVSKAISGLEAGTHYHYRIVATNSGGTTKGEDQTFVPGWTIHLPPNPEGAKEAKLNSVSCTAANECSAVGSYVNSSGTTTTLAERWNGTSWSIQSTPNPEGASTSSLNGISCASSTACTAVGSSTKLGAHGESITTTLAERWNGTSWSIQSTPNPTGSLPRLTSVSCTSECTAVGAYKNGSGVDVTLAERWNGTSWSIQTTPSPEGASTSNLNGVSCTSSTACTAVGNSTKAVGHEESITTTLAERWNGTSWSIQSTPNPSGNAPALEGVSCVSTTECIAIGQYSSSGEKVLAERWNGTSWSLQTISNPEGASIAYLIGISCTSSSSCTAVGYTGEAQEHTSTVKTLAERWNGTSWEVQTSPNPEGGSPTRSLFVGASCKSATVCTAVGNYQNSSGIVASLAEGY